MNRRRWLSLGLILACIRLTAAETPGPSVFSGFDGDPAWYAFMAGDGRTLVGWEAGATRGVVRVWDGETWVRGYLDDTTDFDVVPGATSLHGNVIVGRTQARAMPFRTGAAVWERGESGWIRTDITPGETHGSAYGLSDDGNVILGTAGGSYSWGEPCVWERAETGWTRTLLPKLNASDLLKASQISADGQVVVGVSSRPNLPYLSRGVVWRRTEAGWAVGVLPVDEMVAAGSRISALSRDGQTVIGHMLQRTTQYSVGHYAWTWDGSAWRWDRLPALVRDQGAEGWEISRDGAVIIGTADRSENKTSMRAVWKKSDEGVWTLPFAGSPRETDDFPGQLTADGRLALAQPRFAPYRLWNLVNGKLLTLQSLVANLDLSAEAGWDFSEGQLQWQAYSAQDNTYTLVGWGHKNGVATTFAITLYAPFLTGENPTIGGWIDVELPDMGEKGYRMGALPPGLKYDAKEKRIRGLVTQTGTFTVKYRNLTTGRAKESLLKVVPFSRKQQGVRALELTPPASDKAPGQLKIKVGKTGGVAAHLTLPGETKRFSFSGVLVPDADSGLFLLKTKRAANETGLVLRRGKGASAVSYRVELQMTRSGALAAQLLAADDSVIAEGAVAP